MRQLTTKELRSLYLAATDGGGMYPGIQADVLRPKVHRALLRDGLIREWFPHNPVHKPRVIATERGREVLREQPLPNP